MTERLITWAANRPGLIVRGSAESGAVFTSCEQYRPLLWRVWGDGPLAMWLMLNPSTADDLELDPTLRRCRNFSQSWGYGGMVIGNAFDYRATDPRNMKAQTRPNSEHNSAAICRAAKLAAVIVCGWGNHGQHNDQARFVLAWLEHAGVADKLTALHVTKAGEPGHPLYLSRHLRPESLRIAVIGTEIWRNICERAAVNEKYEVLQARYQHTPWIVNAPGEGREDDLRDWCREQYGHEYWHVFADEDRQWQWQGGCYVCGHTWFGFHRREQLEAFCLAWDIEMPEEKS